MGGRPAQRHGRANGSAVPLLFAQALGLALDSHHVHKSAALAVRLRVHPGGGQEVFQRANRLATSVYDRCPALIGDGVASRDSQDQRNCDRQQQMSSEGEREPGHWQIVSGVDGVHPTIGTVVREGA